CHRLVIVNFPDPFCGIPFAARLFDTALQFGFPEFHSQSDNLRLFRRRPVGFFDDDFDSREAFPPLIVIAIADPRSAACHNVPGTSSCLSDLESMSAEPAQAPLLTVGERNANDWLRLSLRRSGVYSRAVANAINSLAFLLTKQTNN